MPKMICNGEHKWIVTGEVAKWGGIVRQMRCPTCGTTTEIRLKEKANGPGDSGANRPIHNGIEDDNK